MPGQVVICLQAIEEGGPLGAADVEEQPCVAVLGLDSVDVCHGYHPVEGRRDDLRAVLGHDSGDDVRADVETDILFFAVHHIEVAAMDP